MRRRKGFANLGAAAEDTVVKALHLMASQGYGVFHKVPTAVTPIRRKRGDGTTEIAHAVYSEKAVADVLGVLAGGQGVAIEIKSTDAYDLRLWTLDGRPQTVEPHQRAFLDAWERAGGRAYLLVVWNPGGDWMLIPWRVARRVRKVWRPEGRLRDGTWTPFVVPPLFLESAVLERIEGVQVEFVTEGG